MAVVHGRVQGVMFRDFVRRHARVLGLEGYAKNLSDGTSVEVKAEGPKPALEELLKKLGEGPPRSRVERVDVAWHKPSGDFRDFQIM